MVLLAWFMVDSVYCRDNDIHLQIKCLIIQIPLKKHSPILWRSFALDQYKPVHRNLFGSILFYELDFVRNHTAIQSAVEIRDMWISLLGEFTIKNGIRCLMKCTELL